MEKEVFLETGTYTPCPPVRRTGKGSAADPKAPTLQDATRGPRSTPPAGRTPRMPRLPPVPTGKQPAEDAEAPTGGPGRLPATGDAKVPLGGLGVDGADRGHGDLGHPGVLGRLGVDGERRRPRGRWGASGSAGHRGVPGYRGVLGVLGCPWCPWTPRCRRGASGASKPIIAKTVFGACLKITDS